MNSRKIKEIGKYVMQLLVKQAEQIYTEGMKQDDFLEIIYENIPSNRRTKEGINFFKKVFYYVSDDNKKTKIQDLEDGKVMLDLYEKAILTSAQNALISGNDEIPSKSIWIVTLIIIIIIIIKSESKE